MKDKNLLILLLINLFVCAFRIFYILLYPLDLAPDEALYWDYSRHPQISYYAKPPLTAYIIAFTTSLFGNTELGVRIGAVIMSAITSLTLYYLTKYLFGNSTLGLIAGIIPLLTVGFHLLSVLMTIDTPLILFWTLSMYFYAKAFNENAIKYWIYAGTFGALALLSKYTGILLPFLAFLFSLLYDRKKLKEKGIYISTAIVFTGLLPVLLWNMLNDWVGFKHLFTLAGLMETAPPERKGFSLERIPSYIGGQILILGPSIFPYVTYSWLKYSTSSDKNIGFLNVFSFPVFIMFLFMSIYTKVEANWPAFGYVGAIPITALLIKNSLKKGAIIHISSLLIALFFSIITHFTPLIDKFGMTKLLPPERDPQGRLAGWEELGKFVSRWKDKNTFIFSDRYQITAELAFYVEGNPETFCIIRGRRMNQYDLWKYKMKDLKGYNAIFVSYSSIDNRIKRGFKKVLKETVYSVKWRGKDIRKFYIYILEGYNGNIKEETTNMF